MAKFDVLWFSNADFATNVFYFLFLGLNRNIMINSNLLFFLNYWLEWQIPSVHMRLALLKQDKLMSQNSKPFAVRFE